MFLEKFLINSFITDSVVIEIVDYHGNEQEIQVTNNPLICNNPEIAVKGVEKRIERIEGETTETEPTTFKHIKEGEIL